MQSKKGMIYLKYTEDSKKSSKAVNTGLYIIIGLCLLIIGGVAWFALSNNEPDIVPEPQSSADEYSQPQTSYNESVMEPPAISSEPIADSVSSEPYESSSSNSSKAEADTKEDVVVFTMPVQGDILKKHSDSELQFSKTYGDMRIHNGIDIKAELGTSISSMGDGVIENIELNTTLGNVITIDHKNGIVIKYAGLDEIGVEKGKSIKSGDIIGTLGTIPAECMDEKHLHIEVFKNGKPVDPLKTLGLE